MMGSSAGRSLALRIARAVVFALAFAPTAASAQTRIYGVAADGSAEFTRIQQAIDRVPSSGLTRAVIQIAPGRYYERLTIPSGKVPLVLAGFDRNATFIELDHSSYDSKGRWVATPVLRIQSNDVVIRAVTIRNLAGEPGGTGGQWDSAIFSSGDRLILNDVRLRADHDTLLVYGPGAGLGPAPRRVYVHGSTLQGRGDFVASFTSLYVENSVLETIRDRGHFLYQAGIPGEPTTGRDAMVVRNSVFTGRSLDATWPAGVTNLTHHARVYLLGNRFEYDAGANRPAVHFHDAEEPFTSTVRHQGNTQGRSTLTPLIWNVYSVPGTPRRHVTPTLNDFGEPILAGLSSSAAGAITPLWLFGNWDPRRNEPRSACEDGIDNDGDGRVDMQDAGCASRSDFTEAPDHACGIGPELALGIPLLWALRRRRRAR